MCKHEGKLRFLGVLWCTACVQALTPVPAGTYLAYQEWFRQTRERAR